MNQTVRIGGEPLSVQVMDFPSYVVGQWVGAGPEGAREIAMQAAGELLARLSEHVVLDLGCLDGVSDAVTQVLVKTILGVQRQGRNVCLVRCPDALFERLQRGGVTGAITHSGSLLDATKGLTGEPSSALEMHLQSSPQLLHRLRSVVSAVAKQAGLSEPSEIDVKIAVTEAATNAMVHGSPEGVRNHVRITFNLDPGALIVDVADQGPGFDPARVAPPQPQELPEGGFGLHMIRRSMDRVEFYRDDRGMMVRMTKFLPPSQGDWAQ